MSRFDLFKAVANLAKNVSKWNANCDKIAQIGLLCEIVVGLTPKRPHRIFLGQIGPISLQ